MDTFKHGSGWCCAWCNREDDERDAEMASQALDAAQPVQPAQHTPMFTKRQLEIIKASARDSADISPHQEYEDLIQKVDDLLCAAMKPAPKEE